jgi:hypothetical protein
MKIRPLSKRINLDKYGIDDPESKRLQDAEDEDGVIRLDQAYDMPKNEADKSTKTVVKILDEKGYVSEENLYRREYLLRATHQLMINGASTSQISQKLNISVREARDLKRDLTARQINEVKTLDKNKVAGQALMFYDHIAAKALQIINKEDAQDKLLRHKVEALKVALQAQTDKQKFLAMSGFWSNPLNNAQGIEDKHINGANDIRDIMDAVLTGTSYEIVTDEDNIDDGIELL